MALKIFNTLSGKKEEFKPIKGKKVGMYVCGPTVYDDCHIGHARAYISFDIIVRYLKFSGYDVTYVRNITDVDDKIINKANAEKKDFGEIAERYTESFHKDMKNLGLLEPDIEPKASEHINDMQNFISGLMKKGAAYKSQGDVYFSVDAFKDYAKLSKRNLDDMEAGARVEVSEIKKNPFDFALWKKAKEGEPSWDSPWGKGRPGWHIECSAMSSKYLGESFDIHGGGRDLIFPHHENEIAQSEAFSGKPFAKYWIHNGFVNINKQKMSKSLGNTLTIDHLLSKFSVDAFKHFILSTHYRSPIDFTEEYMAESEKAVGRVYTFCQEAREILKGEKSANGESYEKFAGDLSEAMDDDFNSAKVIGLLFDQINKGFVVLKEVERSKKPDKSKLRELSDVLSGLDLVSEALGIFEYRKEPEKYFHRDKKKDEKSADVKEIEVLITKRVGFRNQKEWAKADEVRKTLLDKYGVELEDKKDGTRWKFVK